MLDETPFLAPNQHETMFTSQVWPPRRRWLPVLNTERVLEVARASVCFPEKNRSLILSILELREVAFCEKQQKQRQRHGWAGNSSLWMFWVDRPCLAEILGNGHASQFSFLIPPWIQGADSFCRIILYKMPFAMHSFLAFQTTLPPTGGHLTIPETIQVIEKWQTARCFFFLWSVQCSSSLWQHFTVSLGVRGFLAASWEVPQRQATSGPAFPSLLHFLSHWPIYLPQWSSANARRIHSAQSALESSGDNNATIHYFKTNIIWSVDLSGNAKLVPLKEQLAREEHVTSPRAEGATWGLQCSFLTPGHAYRLSYNHS